MTKEYQPCIGVGDPISYRPNIKPVILGDWEEEGLPKIFEDFGVTSDVLVGADLLFAYYCYEDYSGRAYVLYAKDGKFYEVHNTHCSCWGLEYDGWEPEECTLEELRVLIDKRDECEFEGDYTRELVIETLEKYLALTKVS